MKAKHDLCVWLYYENVRSSTRCDKVNKIMSKAMKKQSLQTMLRFTIQLSMTIISCSQQHTPSTHSTHTFTSQNLIVAVVCPENETFSALPSVRYQFYLSNALALATITTNELRWILWPEWKTLAVWLFALYAIYVYTQIALRNWNWYRYEILGWNSLDCWLCDWLANRGWI